MQTLRPIFWAICLTTGFMVVCGCCAGCNTGGTGNTNAVSTDGDTETEQGPNAGVDGSADGDSAPPKKPQPASHDTEEIHVDSPEKT